MRPYDTFPEKPIGGAGPMAAAFLARGVQSFRGPAPMFSGYPMGTTPIATTP